MTAHAWGLQTGILFTQNTTSKFRALSTEFIIWKNIPALFSVSFFGWGKRAFPPHGRGDAFVLFRLQFLFLDWEIYILGGQDE